MDIVKQILQTRGQCMILRVCVQDDATRMYYISAIEKHNAKLSNGDAGFDIFVPPSGNRSFTSGGAALKIDFGIKCQAQMVLNTDMSFDTGFYIYPRSSLSKTRLRLANSVGIIDAGYRGNLIGVFDGIGDGVVQPGDRLLQICAPGLVPIVVLLADEINENTERGSGGFGSTGR